MNTIETFNAKEDFEGYKRVRHSVISLYNETSSYKEDPNCSWGGFTQPELCFAFSLGDGKGGICVERHVSRPDIGVITFIAVSKDFRGNGLARKLVDFATEHLLGEGADLCLVQLNPDDNKLFWNGLGFKIPSMVGSSEALLR